VKVELCKHTSFIFLAVDTLAFACRSIQHSFSARLEQRTAAAGTEMIYKDEEK